jgi:hypothetical protein
MGFRLLIILLAFCLGSCSIPNLEEAECLEARNDVRQFYSFHFGNDMKPSAENLKQREKFLSAGLIGTLSASGETLNDYFTATSDYPKAFRLGTCKAISPGKVEFQLLLFWRDDTRNEQKELAVETVRENGKWLVDKVLSR